MTDVTELDNNTDISHLSATIQDYLSLIYVMERDEEPVVGAKLAELLEVTPPTVTNTLKRMTRDDLITMDKKGTHLTEQGWNAARVVMRRHMLMEWMMVKTLPWSKLHEEAHHLEHAISSMAEEALDEQLGNPKTCPHGNPLPGFEDVVADWIPLTELAIGQKVIIRRIHELAEENAPLLSFLGENKVLPNTEAIVSDVLPFNETITIEIDSQPVSLGNITAKYIFVELRD
ncbi:MAG: metal-dependent transcriptional regulator [Anaerolineae bacterium]|jgi:DtxR family transcriptional regulator, Mn-dependent transcriptional regulator|nr:metal-dependent transcriptional regulator [Anaerolineae bacterium]MBT7782425.1 metal-dependent transcriptional regulator [Anaerolineae bacterium]